MGDSKWTNTIDWLNNSPPLYSRKIRSIRTNIIPILILIILTICSFIYSVQFGLICLVILIILLPIFLSIK